MNKFHILVIVLFGFLLIPSSSFACENNSAKHSCKKETSSKMDEDDCCKNDNHSKNKNHDGCGGKCNHSKCGCASSCKTSITIDELNFNSTIFDFSSEKQKFNNYETFISSGFNSLWLIPKIG
ncbi:hypothetical protein [Flavobacterium sp. AED]|uniref:hypothetical protein n=1 Tax=Flavobacterium sp. AED TaxID=1423323 RepID=UPI00057DC2A6|nr:hypothetical protein [Flavobacterium sp. AED]KIA85489.1 hypothetical protein OA85_09315 [Flavobacterium sp. AED]